MTSAQPAGRFTGRTKFITAASIVAVSIAGTVAVGANIGILNAADNTDVGTLSAAGDLLPPATQVVDVYLDEASTTIAPATTSSAPAAPAPSGQAFTVDAAGTVNVVTVDGGIRLDQVAPADGWTWSLTQTNAAQLTVSFTDGARSLEFVAALQPDGTVSAAVNEPVQAAQPATGSTGSTGYTDDDSDEYEGGEDDD